jgi:DNA-binding SARP family transcriptional activator
MVRTDMICARIPASIPEEAVFQTVPMRIELVGPFRLTLPAGPVRLSGPRPTVLFAMLAAADGGAVPRAMLMDRFWGDRPERQAAASLRQTLYTLRQSLGTAGDRIASDEGVVRLDLSGASVDLREEMALPPLRTDRAQLIARARREVLAGLALSADGAEAWLREIRAAWRDRAAAALRATAEAALADGDWDGARTLARTLHDLDPFSEEAAAVLMRAEARLAGPAAARRLYDGFRDRLRDELGVDPSPDLAEALEGWARAPRAGRCDPVAGILWPDDGTTGGAGLSGAARTILAEEFADLGVRVVLADADAATLPALYALRGGVVPFAGGEALVMELLAPAGAAGREVLQANRVALRWPLDFARFEREVAERARVLGRRILRHATAEDPDLPGAEESRRQALHAAMAGAASLATMAGTAAAATHAVPDPALPVPEVQSQAADQASDPNPLPDASPSQTAAQIPAAQIPAAQADPATAALADPAYRVVDVSVSWAGFAPPVAQAGPGHAGGAMDAATAALAALAADLPAMDWAADRFEIAPMAEIDATDVATGAHPEADMPSSTTFEALQERVRLSETASADAWAIPWSIGQKTLPLYGDLLDAA